jgi:small acid-soluble spore protein O
MTTHSKHPLTQGINNSQEVKESRQFDHELANEPLTAEERQNNKKRKKNQ